MARGYYFDFEESVTGFDPQVCYRILAEDYGKIFGIKGKELKVVKYYNSDKQSLEEAEKEREKLEHELKEGEAAVQGFSKGYAVVKIEKHDNREKVSTKKYKVTVSRKTCNGKTFVEIPEYNRDFSSLHEAEKYAEKLFRELPLDYTKLLRIVIKSQDNKRVIIYEGKCSVGSWGGLIYSDEYDLYQGNGGIAVQEVSK